MLNDQYYSLDDLIAVFHSRECSRLVNEHGKTVRHIVHDKNFDFSHIVYDPVLYE